MHESLAQSEPLRTTAASAVKTGEESSARRLRLQHPTTTTAQKE
jgi:hypothetical protein